MINRIYEVIFEVTETCQNGNEKRHKISVYMPLWKDSKPYGLKSRIEDGTAALKEQHYYDIKYVDTKFKTILTSGFEGRK